MEFVIVKFPQLRKVMIDGRENGETNRIMMVERGTHLFSLLGRPNYKPQKRTKVVKNTSSATPLEINFEKK